MPQVEVARTLLDDVRDFIDEKWKHSECERCGTDKWAIAPEPLSYVSLDAGINPSPFSGQAMACVALICTNCGNLRLVAKGAFDKWREERTEKEKT